MSNVSNNKLKIKKYQNLNIAKAKEFSLKQKRFPSKLSKYRDSSVKPNMKSLYSCYNQPYGQSINKPFSKSRIRCRAESSKDCYKDSEKESRTRSGERSGSKNGLYQYIQD